MPPSRVNAVWLQPISTDPGLLVNREEELDDLVRRLDELREAQLREAHFMITGARGVGKSIFTRAALARFEKKYPDQAVCLTVDSRGLRYRPFLNRLANRLVDEIKPRAEKFKRLGIARVLDQLALFANHSQISRAQTETVARRYGADATLGADLLLKLQSKLTWEETRSLGQTVQSSLTVTDELLHAAITATLERLDEDDSRWMVVVFFDDLDQALPTDHEEDVAMLFRHVLDLRPCVSLVHFRTEALVENVAREATEKIDLKPLTPEVLFELVRRRLEAATETVKKQFPVDTDWSAVHRLAACTGNPLVFLRWVHGLMRSQLWPPSASWKDAGNLARLVFTADPFNGADPELVRRLAEIVDRCDGGRPNATLLREDLLRGCAKTDPGKAPGMTEQEIDDLVKLQVLLPKHRFQPTLGYRMQPVLDLLRPSVRAKL
ncbi:AAA family ATPase [Polyangium sorediatum]|uniref:ATP-binding protein n=1 Tax=Polyangium sorediatum TaxID=889274 RepID=A0ABT6P0Y9_9BACT|nr:ATP-binding protein [Polyangium sorediatum]MDI1434257.1 ATP-binding protein [Polyangium sorediatum]